jgi:hypothetical protein
MPQKIAHNLIEGAGFVAISSQDLGKEYVASVPVKSGMFALKYVSSASDRPPRVFVQVSPSSSDDVTLVFLPGSPKGVLEEPKNQALVVAEREGNLHLTVVPCAGGGSSARVQLEPFSLDRSPAAHGPEARNEVHDTEAEQAGSAAPAEHRDVETGSTSHSQDAGSDGSSINSQRVPRPLSLTCHVARHGDISVGAGVWVGGPEAPAVIEGATLDWVGSDGATLEYQALMQGAQGRWTPWTSAGEYVGSRARGLALVGLRIRIVEGVSDKISLNGEAVFLGCPVVKEQGRTLEFTCAPHVDPMVGLRIEISGDAAQSESGDVKASPMSEPASSGAGRGALRIFRSRKRG